MFSLTYRKSDKMRLAEKTESPRMNSSAVHNLQRIADRWAKHAAGAIIILVVLGVGYAAGWSARGVSAQERAPLTTIEKVYANLYNQISPSVVSIGVIDPLFGVEVSNGSGFVIDADGHVLTNAHVVNDSGAGTFLEVSFFDGTHVRGNVVGIDPESDLARAARRPARRPLAAGHLRRQRRSRDRPIGAGNRQPLRPAVDDDRRHHQRA